MIPPKAGSGLKQEGAELWAITSYYNPIGYQRRRDNYRIFRERLSVPLIAVELAYDSEFELEKSDADILIQLRGGAVLWQKERLLNIALQALPKSCRKVAWLDCDIVFGSDDWAEKANAALEQSSLIQMFRRAHYLDPQWRPGMDMAGSIEFSRPSAMLELAQGRSVSEVFGRRVADRRATSCLGLAWAARRQFLDRHLLYDACIIGAGDRAFACAAYRCMDAVMLVHQMNQKQKTHYLGWAEGVADDVRSKEPTYLDVDLYHLWHGDVAQRRGGRQRHDGLTTFQFDPDLDIVRGENGAWLWNTDKPDMHDYIRGFFISRRDDG